MMPEMVFSVCLSTLRTPKFWHVYVIMYCDFIIIVKPCFDLWNRLTTKHIKNVYDSRTSTYPKSLWFSIVIKLKKIIFKAYLKYLPDWPPGLGARITNGNFPNNSLNYANHQLTHLKLLSKIRQQAIINIIKWLSFHKNC